MVSGDLTLAISDLRFSIAAFRVGLGDRFVQDEVSCRLGVGFGLRAGSPLVWGWHSRGRVVVSSMSVAVGLDAKPHSGVRQERALVRPYQRRLGFEPASDPSLAREGWMLKLINDGAKPERLTRF
jgi:hypothetical protein